MLSLCPPASSSPPIPLLMGKQVQTWQDPPEKWGGSQTRNWSSGWFSNLQSGPPSEQGCWASPFPLRFVRCSWCTSVPVLLAEDVPSVLRGWGCRVGGGPSLPCMGSFVNAHSVLEGQGS